jgi:hypothetical protein
VFLKYWSCVQDGQEGDALVCGENAIHRIVMEMHLWNTGVVRLHLLGSPQRADDSYQHDDDDDGDDDDDHDVVFYD